jgi:hypothetical protein
MTSKTLTRDEYLALRPEDALTYARVQMADLAKQLAFANSEDTSSIEVQKRQWTLSALSLEQLLIPSSAQHAHTGRTAAESGGKALPKMPYSTPMVRTMDPKVDFRDDLRDFERVMMANKIEKEHWPFFLIDRIDDSNLMCILDPSKSWSLNKDALLKHLLPADYLLSDANKFDAISWYPEKETLVALHTRYKFLANAIEYPLRTVYACNHYLKVLRKADPGLAAFVKQQLVAINHNSADDMVYDVDVMMEIARTYTPSGTTAYRQAAPTTPRTSFASEAQVAVDSPRSGSYSQPTSRDASPARPELRMSEFPSPWTPGRSGSPHPTAGSASVAAKVNSRQPRDFGPNVPANNLRSANPGVLKHGAPIPAPRLMSIFIDPDDDEDHSWHGARDWDPP